MTERKPPGVSFESWVAGIKDGRSYNTRNPAA